MPALVRPRRGRVIAGVCAALAPRFDTTPNVVRLVAVLSCLLPGPQFVAYLLLWVVLPAQGSERTPGSTAPPVDGPRSTAGPGLQP